MADLYTLSIPVFISYLHNLTNILKKSEAYANEGHITKEELLNFRLREDMRPLIYSVQTASSTVNWLVDRVAGAEHITLEDDAATFEDLYARIERQIEILKTINPEDYNKDADKEVIMNTRSMGSYKFKNKQEYIFSYAMPNFYFHLTTAYCIARHVGVPLSLFDYLTKDFTKV